VKFVPVGYSLGLNINERRTSTKMHTTYKTQLLLAVTLGSLCGSAAMAANPTYYYDLNGVTPGSGVTSGARYTWNTNDLFWNSSKAGDDSGSFSTWMDAAALGLTNGTTAADNGCWLANFSADSGGANYVVTIPAGEVRDSVYVVANGDTVTLTGGTIRPQGLSTYNAGFAAAAPGSLTLSNLTILTTDCSLLRFIPPGSSANALIKISSGVNVGFKQWELSGAGTTVDFGSFLDNNLIFTTNYPGGGQIAALFFFGYGDNQVVQGSGMLTLPLAHWYFPPFPHISWQPDGYGNGQGGGFAARGGKLTVDLFGDGRTVTWNGNGDPTNYFCGKPFSLIFNSTSADSEVEFQNGIDLFGYTSPKVKVLTAPTSAAFATISGVISDSVGGGTLTKVGQNGYQAAGKLVLSGANTYSGTTSIQEGMLMITSAHVGGGEFDVVGNEYSNSGFGVIVTSSTASVPVSALVMDSTSTGNGTILEFDYNAQNTQGAILATNFTVNSATTINLGGSFHVGQFPLIKYEGSIGGMGFADLTLGSLPAGVTASLVDDSAHHSVDLNVTSIPRPAPFIVGASVSSGMFSFSAMNGAPNSSCAVLSTTSLASPMSSWATNSVTNFNGNGTFLYTSPVGAGPRFYLLKQ